MNSPRPNLSPCEDPVRQGHYAPRWILLACCILGHFLNETWLAAEPPPTTGARSAITSLHLDKVQNFNERHGLPHNRANAVLRNHQGFIWIGTEDGLARHDGYSFRRFAFPDNANTQSDILELFEDRRGQIWASTRDGMGRFDPETQILHFYPPAAELEIDKGGFNPDAFVEDDAGQLWIASYYGLLKVDSPSQELRRQPLPPLAPIGEPAASSSSGIKGSERQPEVYSIAPDHEGHLWIGAEQGIFRLETASGDIETWILEGMDKEGNHGVYTLLIDHELTVWAATFQGLWHKTAGAQKFSEFRPSHLSSEAADSVPILNLTMDDRGQLWFLTQRGLHRWSRQQDRLDEFPLCDQATCLEPAMYYNYRQQFDARGDLWIATEGEGLLHFDAILENFQRYTADSKYPSGLTSNIIHDLVIDPQGIFWLATHSGLDKWDPRLGRFGSYSNSKFQGDLTGPGVWGIHQNETGVLWLGSYRNGLSRLDREAGTTQQFPYNPGTPDSPSGRRISAIADAGDGDLWVATDQGLDRFDSRSKTFTPLRHDPDDENSLSNDVLFSLLEDSAGRLWVGTRSGMDLYRPATRDFRRCMPKNDLDAFLPYALAESVSGGIWATALGKGLYHLTADCESVLYEPIPEQPNSLNSTTAVAVYQDTQGAVWIGFEDSGLDRWDPENGTFENFQIKDGLPSNRVLGIIEDDEECLWLATGKGLSRFDKTHRTFRNFDVGDGLINNTFTIGSVLQGDGGELFFGGGLGLTAFYPEDIIDDPQPPDVLLTDFQLFYQTAPLQAEDPDSPLSRVVTVSDDIVLDHRQYIFAIEMTPLHLANPAKNRLSYKLEGFNENWVKVDASQRLAQYSNLQAGDYTFKVKAANADGLWSDEKTALRIRVMPPPWKTWWAYTLYLLSFVLALWGYAQWHRRRLAREQKINHQLRQVDRFKDEFLANTSHELRTPLYGITGLAESLLEGAQGDLTAGARSNLQMIVASGQRLAGLVNQILDFSRVKRDKIELARRPVALSTLTELVLAIVKPLVRAKDVVLVQHVSPDLPPALGDEDRIHQILLNLVGNAIKFTDEGQVEVTAVEDDAMLIVRVSDTGIGIPKDRQERIFEAFEQANASTERLHGGTGLGLAVTRELVTLHGGKLWVESVPDEGSTFAFTLPVAQEADLEADSAAQPHSERSSLIVSSMSHWETADHDHAETIHQSTADATTEAIPTNSSQTHRARILVVDDESVLREVLHNFLAPEGYETTLAASGPQALELLSTQTFDLVLLDVMMPRMSGFEVCTRIRQDKPADDLPVIFLTAKNQVSDLVRAFGDGASDYLTKPIARQELLSRVRTHLDLANVHQQRTRQVQMLTGLLPICSSCKKIRDDGGSWQNLESYLNSRTEASFSHSICPTCLLDLYPEISLKPPSTD